VLFQVEAGRGSKSVYRVVLIDSTNQATLAYSPRVTVKLK
jgi:hypothetical protein